MLHEAGKAAEFGIEQERLLALLECIDTAVDAHAIAACVEALGASQGLWQAITSRQQSVETLQGMQHCVQQQFALQESKQPRYHLGTASLSSDKILVSAASPSASPRAPVLQPAPWGVMGQGYDWETLGSISMLLGDGRPEWIGARTWTTRQDLLMQHCGWYYPRQRREWYTSLLGKFRMPYLAHHDWRQKHCGVERRRLVLSYALLPLHTSYHAEAHAIQGGGTAQHSRGCRSSRGRS